MKQGRNKAGRCVYCGSEEDLTVDHVVPLSRWREFRVKRRVLDNPSNRVTCCRRCNAEKRDMAPAEWFLLHPEYRKRFEVEARYFSDRVRSICGMRPR